MKRFSLLLIILIYITADLRAQGFNSFNNRNHPYLNWEVAETEHFKIIYPDRISGLIPEAAAIAEESYRALSQNLDTEFEKKIPIYLSDEDEIVNGFANPIRQGYTMIWVNLNDYAETWTGNEKWLRKVIAHELAHIFHFKAVWSDFGLLNYAIAEPLPRVWTEGLAQYQTEYWDSQRGDRWLRKAIFDSRPGYRDGSSIENGRLMYASGNSQLRFFTEQYGDSSLVNLLAHRDSFLWLDYHDFYSAFREVTDVDYSDFYESWRKHMNIYYHTLASQMERTDSLGTTTESLPGRFYMDMALSPNDSLVALLSVPSMARPVRNLYLVTTDSTKTATKIAEGGINNDLSWSPDSRKIYYSRKVRDQSSSLVNDIFMTDRITGKETRLTYGRRARYPVPGPGNQIAYVVNENGTGNIFLMDLETGTEERLTRYTGDVQLITPAWNSAQNSWIFQRFNPHGERHVVVVDADSKEEVVIDGRGFDNRNFIVSPDGMHIAYHSLRNEVPNVFTLDFRTGEESRVTNLFTGGEVFGWFAETDSAGTQQLLIKASETKKSDHVYRVDAERDPYSGTAAVPHAYASWRGKQAPIMLPSQIAPDESLITRNYRYRPLTELKHAATILLPYYGDSGNWGLFGTTGFTEPLGKHMIAATGNLSFGNLRNSFGILSYINNQFYPTLTTSLYKIPGSAYFYGSQFLIEELTGGEITMNLPIDLFEGPYRGGALFARLRHVQAVPFDQDRFRETEQLPRPERGRQTDLSIGVTIKKQRPWRENLIHPLDGWGARLMVTGAEKIPGSDVQFATADLSAYSILPGPGLQRFYLYGRYQKQWGSPLPQNFIGFSTYDNIHLNLPGEVPLFLFNEAERVRGYREFVAGDQVLFGSIEYRIPFASSLETRILGILELGASTFSLFSDAGVVWNPVGGERVAKTEERWGAGVEIKNELRLFGVGISHAAGVAQPAQELFTDGEYDLYYRVRAVIPF